MLGAAGSGAIKAMCDLANAETVTLKFDAQVRLQCPELAIRTPNAGTVGVVVLARQYADFVLGAQAGGIVVVNFGGYQSGDKITIDTTGAGASVYVDPEVRVVNFGTAHSSDDVPVDLTDRLFRVTDDLPKPTKVESMAAAILSDWKGIVWRSALDEVKGFCEMSDPRVGRSRREAQVALDHIPYLADCSDA